MTGRHIRKAVRRRVRSARPGDANHLIFREASNGRVVQSCPGAHPRLFVVEPAEDFLHKAARALTLLKGEVPECCQHHVRRFFWDDETTDR